MGFFGDIKSFLVNYGSGIFILIFLALADQLWGENIFQCPCGESYKRITYCIAYVVAPPVIIIAVGKIFQIMIFHHQLPLPAFTALASVVYFYLRNQ
jgi:hypothetical protein